MGHHIPLAPCFVALFLGGYRAEDPISANEGQPAGGHGITSAIDDPHGLGGSAREHLARHKHPFRALWRRREVSVLAKARQDLLGLSRAWLKG